MLNTILTDPENGYLYVRVDGEVTRADYEKFEPAFRQLAGSREKPLPIMVEIGDEFSDWNSAKTVWDESRFGSRHRERLGRIAVVGDGRVQQWSAHASNLLPGVELRFFEHAKRANAEQWLRGEPMTELP